MEVKDEKERDIEGGNKTEEKGLTDHRVFLPYSIINKVINLPGKRPSMSPGAPEKIIRMPEYL